MKLPNFWRSFASYPNVSHIIQINIRQVCSNNRHSIVIFVYLMPILYLLGVAIGLQLEATTHIATCSFHVLVDNDDFYLRLPCPPLAKRGSLTHSQALALSKRARDVTALRCSEPLRYKVSGASKPSPWLCGMGPPGYNLL